MTSPDWPVVEIGSVCEGIFDGPHATPTKTTAGPVFLGIANLSNGRLNLSDTEHVSEDDFVAWTRRVTPEPGDVVFSYETRLGEAAEIPAGLRCCLGRRMALMRPDRTKVAPHFLLYAYLGPQFQSLIRDRTISGSTVDRIPLTDFSRFPLRLPCIAEQRRIAGVLGALDDKIEHNLRVQERLFNLTNNAFRARFDEVPLDTPLGDIADVVDCLHSRKPERRPAGLPLLQLWNIRNDGLLDMSDPYLIDEADYAEWTRRMEARDGDCVITNVGRIGAVGQMVGIRTAALGRNMTGVRCRSGFPYPTFVASALLSTRVRQEIDLLTDAGTVMGALNVKNIPRLRLPASNVELVREFQLKHEPAWRLRGHLLDEVGRLSAIRDELLPILVSGRLRVPDSYDPDEVLGAITEHAGIAV